MVKNKFIQGSIHILQNMTEDKLKQLCKPIIKWADIHYLDLNFGYDKNNELCCNYKFEGYTQQFCKGCAQELKFLLKQYFGKIEVLYEAW
ncbi:hypothetical protein [Anaerovorax sp. IOR16]|uniref:hypothetical protein n=1 Tax=Anaerovorax sp. IOR16 TaxID=2773458 RepID=UPI0019CFDB3C|nr:hypothetical protein [Anaerovorax sp. IOR16]